MLEPLQTDLNQEVQSPFHEQMLKDCKALVDMSRRKMSTFYNQWDDNDKIYRGERVADVADKKASERDEPVKMVVPISYAQIQTFVAFCFSLFTQRERFYELLGMSREDHVSARIAEALLQRDLTYNQFEAKLYQFLLDIARFGLGVLKTGWVRETQRTRTTVNQPRWSFLGISMGTQPVETIGEQVKFLGNRIYNVSPYRFFPDTRIPMSRFQEGEFVASEDEYSVTALKKMEKDGLVAGVNFIKPFTKEGLLERGLRRFEDNLGQADINATRGSGQSPGSVIVTEVQRVIIPKEYKIDNDVPLGEEDYPIKYVVWYANDKRVIKCEPLGYLHDEFTYDVAEFNPDLHHTINNALADTIGPLQDVIAWFINSRVASVRKVISNKFIVDPEGVEWKDIESRSPVVRLKPTAARQGVERFIKQLDVHDVTAGHIVDAKFLHEILQVVTGINESLLGQFHQGRRSATEARNVGASAAARLKMYAQLIFRGALEPMGRKMLSNLRDGLDVETVVRVVGLDEEIKDLQQGAEGGFLKVDKSMLVGSYDFELFDGTLPSEKIFLAQVLQEVLLALVQRPDAAIALQVDPKEMLYEMLRMRGIRNPERFALQAPNPMMVAQAQQSMQQQQQPTTGGNGQPVSPKTNGNQRPGTAEAGPFTPTGGFEHVGEAPGFAGISP